MGSGICGAALVRAANAMLSAFGNDEITLLLPGTGLGTDAAGQLGLVDPGVQSLVISPAVIHILPVTNVGPLRKVQFTLPASVLDAQLSGLGMGSVQDIFDAVLGLEYGGDLFHIESIATENFAGTAYFYVVTAVE